MIFDINGYKTFLPWCTKSEIDKSTYKLVNENEGDFKATLAVGFKSLQFEYTSDVSFKKPNILISKCTGHEWFDVYSKWNVQEFTAKKCKINYEIEMNVRNPIYYTVLKYFVENYHSNIN